MFAVFKSRRQAQVIHIEPQAPTKPAWGQPCNGCGVCCLARPCPLGMLLSRRRHGACAALRWQAPMYRCGALTEPDAVLAQALPAALRWLRAPLQWLLRQLARRWIAAGWGCDCSLELERPAPTPTQTSTETSAQSPT